MTRFYRTVFQLFLWAIVWIIMGINQNDFPHFFRDNFLAYISQALLIIVLVYILAPKLLFKKKHVVFVLVSILLLLFFSFLSGNMIDHARRLQELPQVNDVRMNRPPPFRGAGNGLPSPMIINLLLLCVSYILAIFLETFSFAQKKEEALVLSKTENIENELKFLKSQINPHFLFNSLNNIYSLSIIDASRAQESILYLSDMLRYVLYDCEKPSVAIEKEVTYIEDFINLFLVKSSKKYPVRSTFEIKNSGLQIAPMLLIPFVENAFKHSNIESVKDAFITIELHATNDSIDFIVENSFDRGNKVQDGVGGIGIVNVRKRLSLLYENKHTIEIVENNNIFRVQLKIMTNA
ncbi:MAG: sensor histidine kinase [Flavobacteriaceae bacterium]|jgi:two-component system LytT family sensor kinase|uniref:Sensor histidine kinase n=1 Tax=Flavobacterium kayseriense TaxID=2764714 RepID=A0ABR7J5K1_9FLAO|nr:histidine kinase [Flavobacterium kayseriense]MBC5840825.1 sensor histidine kinase [Flavobacterium kayseriense]MBC5846505.1 sensor histidine kinase [Flavobacterium kayseriense]MBX9888750.1 sensor histidine kinase [Flavobacteriaceae bacterium]